MEELKFNTPENLEKSISISAVLGLISEPFDSQGVATKTYNKHFNNPNSEYYQMTVQQIMDAWSAKGAASCHYGSLLDNYIGLILEKADEMDMEMFKLDYDFDGDERLQGVCNSFDRFVDDYLGQHPELEFVTREQTVYLELSDGNYIKGRFDALFRNKENGHYLIVDWKSSGSVDKQPTPWTGKLLGTAKDLLALNHNTYTLQTYFYKTALETHYLPAGSIVDCIIVQLPGKIVAESNDVYCVHQTAFPYDKDYCMKIFEYAFKKNLIIEKKNATTK
jgi:hypothetical protein